MTTTIERPAVERYARCTLTYGAWTVEPGIEWREGDDFAALTRGLRDLAGAIGLAAAMADPMTAARAAEHRFEATWPGRAFFLEIHDDAGAWTQIYQPYGIPRTR